MQFRLDIHGLSFSGNPIAAIFSPDITVERWSKRINAPGTMVFSMKATSPKATETNLQHYRIVRLYRQNQDGTEGYSPVWLGYIEATRQVDDRIEVICSGMLKLFKKRWAATGQEFTGEASEEAFDLLSDTNTNDGNTGITEGDGGVDSTRSVKAQGDVTVLRAWELLAEANHAEFEINDDGEFRFVSSLGSDKSGSVHLLYQRDGRPGTNVSGVQYGEDGEDMATKIIGKSSASGGLTSERPAAPSANQTTYGMLIEKRQFNEAQDQTTLDAMTEAVLSQIENPITEFRMRPDLATKRLNVRSGEREISGLQFGDVEIGDLLQITVSTENRSIAEAKRVAEIIVEVNEDGLESMSFTLSKAGVFITAAYLDANRITQLTDRVKQIESVL